MLQSIEDAPIAKKAPVIGSCRVRSLHVDHEDVGLTVQPERRARGADARGNEQVCAANDEVPVVEAPAVRAGNDDRAEMRKAELAGMVVAGEDDVSRLSRIWMSQRLRSTSQTQSPARA